jgi:hypothetical protein
VGIFQLGFFARPFHQISHPYSFYHLNLQAEKGWKDRDEARSIATRSKSLRVHVLEGPLRIGGLAHLPEIRLPSNRNSRNLRALLPTFFRTQPTSTISTTIPRSSFQSPLSSCARTLVSKVRLRLQQSAICLLGNRRLRSPSLAISSRIQCLSKSLEIHRTPGSVEIILFELGLESREAHTASASRQAAVPNKLQIGQQAPLQCHGFHRGTRQTITFISKSTISR